MKKTIFALATAAVLAAGTLSAPTTAEARCYGCAVGAGVAAGAAAPSSAARSPTVRAPIRLTRRPPYVVYQGYGAPYPAGCPGGYWARRPLRDPYGNVVGWSRPRFICP